MMETEDTEERIAILENQLHCLEAGKNVDDRGDNITKEPDQIRAEIERLVNRFCNREGYGGERCVR